MNLGTGTDNILTLFWTIKLQNTQGLKDLVSYKDTIPFEYTFSMTTHDEYNFAKKVELSFVIFMIKMISTKFVLEMNIAEVGKNSMVYVSHKLVER